ncbi:hypothetical protein MuYL_1659 [Mucilaginibacter xinganensis]|uniref:Uncharacterized protein n=1 Tax=Mucilaginibacter xinganensis TaxID=1234841 RepID=A0A223NUI8_9SPHI|nr:hypothetical protein MuYL_1659 [Mucilaginibacter xinganensis]
MIKLLHFFHFNYPGNMGPFQKDLTPFCLGARNARAPS